MNAVDKLRKQVEVLREALGRVYGETHDSECIDIANDALAEADRIAAEPAEATDAEVVCEWALADVCESRTATIRNRGIVQLTVAGEDLHGLRQCHTRSFRDLPTAAAWVRVQGGGK